MAKGTKGPVFFYEHEYYAFSNFSSFAVFYKGRLWMTSEHPFQAEKFEDIEIRNKIHQARSAHEAKKIGRAHNDRKRADWDRVRVGIMEDICRTKLVQHDFIQELLKRSRNREIIEDSPKDSFWGWGPDKKGQNNLGKIWMKLRAELGEEI